MNAMDQATHVENNVAQVLSNVADQCPEKDALVFQGGGKTERIKFGQLWAQAGAVAKGLKNAGLEPGDRVIIMIPMSIDLYVALLAAIRMGAVAVFIDPWIPPRQIARFADFAEPKAFIGIPKSHMLRLFRRALRKLPVSVTTGTCWLNVPARYSLNQWKHASDHRSTVAPVAAHDSALITFTSGSSGEPKGANRTHQFLSAQHRALSEEFPYRDSDIDMAMFPVFALNNLVTGITSIVPDMDFRKVAEVNGETIARQMIDHGVTTVTASPPLLDRVAKHVRPEDSPLKLRRILTGGAPVRDSQLELWVERFPETEIIVAYGSTEAEPVGHISAQDRLGLASHGAAGFCTGRPSHLVNTEVIPIVKGKIDLQSRPLEDLALTAGEIGELIVSGEHVCRDYFRNPNATAENKLFDHQGNLWHRMGDTGYFDSEGRFWLVGRVHSTITRDKKYVHPQLIEQAASKLLPTAQRVAAVGVPDEKLGEKVVLVAQMEDLSQDEVSRVIAILDSQDLPCDDIVVTQTTLPVDPRHNSKIDYARLREWFSKE